MSLRTFSAVPPAKRSVHYAYWSYAPNPKITLYFYQCPRQNISSSPCARFYNRLLPSLWGKAGMGGAVSPQYLSMKEYAKINARQLRKNLTDSEKLLWRELKLR